MKHLVTEYVYDSAGMMEWFKAPARAILGYWEPVCKNIFFCGYVRRYREFADYGPIAMTLTEGKKTLLKLPHSFLHVQIRSHRES